MKQPNINSAITIKCDSGIDFYKNWLLFLKPVIDLTSRETDIAAAILKMRYDLSKSISDISILDEVTLSTKSYVKMQAECNITGPHFNVILNELRKKKFLLEGKRINPKCIPNIKEGQDKYTLLLIFELNYDLSGNNQGSSTEESVG